MTFPLHLSNVLESTELLAPTVAEMLRTWDGSIAVEQFQVAAIDPALADTAALCEHYALDMADSGNCVIVAGRRGEEVRFAACVVLATTRADVNGVIRRKLDARKCSFAAMDEAVERTGMEYGGITPFGLPVDWPIFVDSRVIEREQLIVGSGLRKSKLFVPGRAIAEIPHALVIEDLAG